METWGIEVMEGEHFDVSGALPEPVRKPVAMEAFLGGNVPQQKPPADGHGLAHFPRGEIAMSTEAARRFAALEQACGLYRGAVEGWRRRAAAEKARADAAAAKLQRIDALLSAYQLGAPFPTYADLRGAIGGDVRELPDAALGSVAGGVGIVSW